jgi:hypothetical protein
MELTLYYRGELGSNKGPNQKQGLRRAFHKQLSVLWQQDPWQGERWRWDTEDKIYQVHKDSKNLENVDIKHTIGKFTFVPLISRKIFMVADINIQMLRSEPAGTVSAQSGDLDNRVKTLLDALRMPNTPQDLPKDDIPRDNETPFFCLLEDDALIHKFSVTTHRWLDATVSPKEVMLLISIRTSLTKLMAHNEHLGGNVI